MRWPSVRKVLSARRNSKGTRTCAHAAAELQKLIHGIAEDA